MTIIEALTESRESGRSFMRVAGDYSGWIAWDDEHRYRNLSAEDLIADDWIPSAEVIEKITGGRWTEGS